MKYTNVDEVLDKIYGLPTTVSCYLTCAEARAATEVKSRVIDLIEHAPAVNIRHGHWVHVSGYATPGGDPVWKCSECGKGVHIYGIEASSYQGDVSDQQWVSCPNCGAIMGD